MTCQRIHTVLAAALLLLLCACAKPATPPEPTAAEAMESWKEMAKQSQGHSPRGQIPVTEPSTVVDRPSLFNKAKLDAQRPLPNTKISLRMHNAEVVAVIQALARAAGQSIVVSPGVAGTLNVNIVERPWDEVFRGILAANKLTYSFDGNTIRVMASADLQGEVDLAGIKRKAQAEQMAMLKEEPLVTSIASVRFSDAKNLQKTIEKSLSKDKDGKVIGAVDVDEHTNSLIIQAIEADSLKIERVLAKLDAPRSQIKLKAHIVETTKEVARDLGILWGGNYAGSVRSGNKLGLSGGSSLDGTTSTSVLGFGATGTPLGVNLPAATVTGTGTGAALGMTFGKIGGNILEAQLQALAKDNKLNIISSPSIATMDNQKAYTESGERVPYQSVTGTGTSATTSVQFQDAVLRLEITPHIIDDNFIKLQVLIQKDEVDNSRAVSGNPYIVKKKTETTLIARNGETVVISGLSKMRNELNTSGIPGVKDVPGLGWLAKSEFKKDTKDEFMIFITPTVLADWRAGEVQRSFEEIDREQTAKREARRMQEDGGPPATKQEGGSR